MSGQAHRKGVNKLENNQEQILSESILSPVSCVLLYLLIAVNRFPRIYPTLDLRSHSCNVLLAHDTQ